LIGIHFFYRNPASRNFEREKPRFKAELESVTHHPLLFTRPKVNVIDKTKGAKAESEASADPLSDPLSSPMSDPLSSPAKFSDPLSSEFKAPPRVEATSPTPLNTMTTKSTSSSASSGSLPGWDSKKLEIRKEYAFTGSVTMTSTAFSDSGAEEAINTRKVDKYEQRLANLEKKLAAQEGEGASSQISMTLKEFEDHITRLHQELKTSWSRDERVNALRLATHISKLLNEIHNPLFYPSMFIFITDILQEFSHMVFTRLHTKAEEALNEGSDLSTKSKKANMKKLAADFTSADVPASVKETGRNWLYKVSCIKELVGRIYMEISLLSVYRFLTDTDFPMIMNRLSSMIRGIGSPLIAFYARLYLVNISQIVAPQYTQHLLTLFQDMLFTMSTLKEPGYAEELLKRYSITVSQYAYLLSPAISWVLQIVMKYFPQKEHFQSFLSLYRDCTSNNSLVLKHILDHCDGNHFLPHAINGILTLIKNSDIVCAQPTDLMIALGKQLLKIPLPEEQRLPVLNEVWKTVSKGNDMVAYIRCCHVWLQIVMKYYTERELMILLGSLTSKLSQTIITSSGVTSSAGGTTSGAGTLDQETYEKVSVQVENILRSLLSNGMVGGDAGDAPAAANAEQTNYTGLILTSEYFLKIMDVFKGARKVQLCRVSMLYSIETNYFSDLFACMIVGCVGIIPCRECK
jgi:hypothetical protein